MDNILNQKYCCQFSSYLQKEVLYLLGGVSYHIYTSLPEKYISVPILPPRLNIFFNAVTDTGLRTTAKIHGKHKSRLSSFVRYWKPISHKIDGCPTCKYIYFLAVCTHGVQLSEKRLNKINSINCSAIYQLCQSMPGTGQGQTGTSRDKAGTRQGKTGTNRDQQRQSLFCP